MSYRYKLVSIVLLLVTAFLAAYVIVERCFVIPAFISIEKQQAKLNIDRVENLIMHSIDNINSISYDWASWDDTYEYALDNNQDYVDSNLASDTFYLLKTDIVYILDVSGNEIWAEMYDFDEPEDYRIVTDNKFIERSLIQLMPLINNIDLTLDPDLQLSSGIFILDGAPIIYSVRPIKDSDGLGSPRGFFLVGRRLNQSLVEAFSKQLKINFSYEIVGENLLGSPPGRNSNYEVKELTKDTIRVAKYFFSGEKPVLKFITEVTRGISKKGFESVNYAFGALVLVILPFAVLAVAINFSLYNAKNTLEKKYKDDKEKIREEFHDDILNKFAIISLFSEIAIKDLGGNVTGNFQKVKERLSSIKKLAVKSSRHSRIMLGFIKEDEVDWEEFAEQLRCEINSLVRNIDINFEFDSFLKLNSKSNPVLRLCLYNFFRESLGNISRYSDVSNMTIMLIIKDGVVNFIIRFVDVSLGDFEEKELRLDMKDVIEKVVSLGGRFDIERKPEEATIISIFLPVLKG